MPYDALNARYAVDIYEPEETPTGITVFLPGTLIRLDSYMETLNVLHQEQKQVVIGFRKLDPVTPPAQFWSPKETHINMAEKVAGVVRDFRAAYEGDGRSLPEKYNIVGHSLGGKIALMVAAEFDVENVGKIIALDPVVDVPVDTPPDGEHYSTNLNNSQAQEIHLFQSENGGNPLIPIPPNFPTWVAAWLPAWCPMRQNASVIWENYRQKITSFHVDEGAGHFSYWDHEEDEESEQARTNVHTKIREVIR